MSESKRTSARERYSQRPLEKGEHIIALPLAQILNGQPGRPEALLINFIGVNPQTVDLSFMRIAPALCLPFADAFAKWGSKGVSISSRKTYAYSLKKGFFRFLEEENLITVQLNDLRAPLLRDFLRWLGRPNVLDGHTLTESSRHQRYSGFRTVFATLCRLPQYSNQLEGVRVPPAPWPRRNSRDPSQATTQALTQDEWDKLYYACASEVQATMRSVQEGWRLMHLADKSQAAMPGSLRTYDDLGACLARLNHLYPDVLPPWSQICIDDRALGTAINYRHGIRETISYFHPSGKMLFPFVLLLAMHTGYNQGSLLNLRLSDIEMEDVLGEEHLVLSPFKARSGARQLWSFSTNALSDEPGNFIPFVQRWTSRVRRVAPATDRDHLFLFLGIIQKRPSTFGQSMHWEQTKQKFEKSHNLPPFHLRQVRASFLDIIRERSGNDPRAVQQAAGHQSVLTQVQHYTTSATKQRNDEHLGHLMSMMDRWVGTDGLIDPRGVTAEKRDWGAATPGFVCLDPKDSPQPGEISGRACAAYGACPTCPLALVNTQSPHALVRLLQLTQSIAEAQQSIAGDAWLAAWAPRYDRLKHWWLPAFQDPQVIAMAENLRLPTLPPVSALE